MTFRELLDTVEFDDVWKELREGYYLSGDEYGSYQKAFSQLKGITPAPNPEGFLLAVAKVREEDEPCELYYDVFCVKPGSSKRYSFISSPWADWLSLELIGKSIKEYGAAVAAAHSLWEMTYFGFDVAEVAARIEEEAKRWKDNDAEVGSDGSELAAWEEVFKELEVESRRGAEEKAKRIMAENQKVYDRILSDEIQKIKVPGDFFEGYNGDYRPEEWDTGKSEERKSDDE